MLNIPTRDELRTTGNGTLESSRPNSAATALLPSEPNSIEETGLSIGFLADLLLKHIYFTGMLSGQQFSDRVKLPFLNVIDKVLAFLREEEYVEITGSQGGYSERSYEYVITTKGRLKAHEVLERSQYVGPAPVPLQAYLDAVKAQELGEMVIDRATIRRAFEGLVIGDTLLDQIGPAANSARSLFLYGPSGNGKTTIAEGIARMLNGAVLVPYTVEVDGQVIKVFDPLNHRPVADEAEPGDAEMSGFSAEAVGARKDHRWLVCRRPVVVVGGELLLDAARADLGPDRQGLRGAVPDEGQRRHVPDRRLRPPAGARRATCSTAGSCRWSRRWTS